MLILKSNILIVIFKNTIYNTAIYLKENIVNFNIVLKIYQIIYSS